MNEIEHKSQVALFKWAAFAKVQYPELKLMFAIPNGGKRHKAVAAKMKREGAKAGVLDIFLPVARHGYHGLFIEMKAPKGKLTDLQKDWLKDLIGQGYFCQAAYSCDEARKILEAYLTKPI